MSSQNLFNLKAAEAYEKAANDSVEKGDKAKAVEHWEAAANRYIDERMFDKAIACLDYAGRLKEYVIALLQSFDPEKVLAVFQKKRFEEELALAFLHLLSRGEETMQVGAFESCYALAQKAMKRSVEQALPYLKGAMLAASWAGDEDKLNKAAELAPINGAGSKRQEDRIRLFTLKIAVTGDFQLMRELGKLASPVESARTLHTPFQIRLLAPIYLYRGIKLTALLDTMRSNRALLRYAKLYDALFAGIDAGKADKAVEDFLSAIEEQSDHPDPASPVTTWEDVERRFSHIFYAQPECLAATVLWDQIWATRAGVEELRKTVAQGRNHVENKQWTEAIGLFEKAVTDSLFHHLPKELQAQVYRLGCISAFQAEQWDRVDQWAAILEEKYGLKEVIKAVAAAGEASGETNRQ